MKKKTNENLDQTGSNFPEEGANIRNQELQPAASPEIEAHNLDPDAHPVILEKIKNMTGNAYYLQKYEQPGHTLVDTIDAAIADMPDSGGELDCTYYHGTYTIDRSIDINKPIQFKFGNIHIKFNNTPGTNMFNVYSNNIAITGIGRVNRKDDLASESNTTTFEMLNIDSTLDGYHIKGRGVSGLRFTGFNLVGIRSSRGRQYGSTQYPINGVGGIYLEKQNPGTIASKNAVNNLIIERVLIVGTKAHGIYLDTPILSTLDDVRVSDAGGHGIFVWNGTTILFQSVYVTSANNAGIVLYAVSYASAFNTVTEYNTLGWWIRSCFSINLFTPAVEWLYTQGEDPWGHVYSTSRKRGLALHTYTEDGTVLNISDVSSTYHNKFTGIPLMITGGRSINVYSMYAYYCSETGLKTEAYPNGVPATENFRWLAIYGNARDFYIQYPHFVRSTVDTINKADIDINTDNGDGIVLWNPATANTLRNQDGTLRNDWDGTTLISNSEAITAPIYKPDTITNVKIESGNTDYTGNKNPLNFAGGATGSYDGSEEVTIQIPTSLPADGGNADTIGGIGTDDIKIFRGNQPNPYGVEYYQALKSGWYWNTGQLPDLPDLDQNGLLEVTKHNDEVLLVYSSSYNGNIYTKRVSGESMTEWTKIPSNNDLNNLVPNTRKINNKPLSSDIVLNASDVGAVPTSRTINGKPLTSDIELTAADVGASAFSKGYLPYPYDWEGIPGDGIYYSDKRLSEEEGLCGYPENAPSERGFMLIYWDTVNDLCLQIWFDHLEFDVNPPFPLTDSSNISYRIINGPEDINRNWTTLSQLETAYRNLHNTLILEDGYELISFTEVRLNGAFTAVIDRALNKSGIPNNMLKINIRDVEGPIYYMGLEDIGDYNRIYSDGIIYLEPFECLYFRHDRSKSPSDGEFPGELLIYSPGTLASEGRAIGNSIIQSNDILLAVHMGSAFKLGTGETIPL